MAAFPSFPLDTKVEMFLAGAWTDITSDVMNRGNIAITRGLPNETSAPTPSTCLFQLKNRTGKYNPRNPTGPYYGSVGRATPTRVAIRTGRDTFARTVSSGWGTDDTGHAWTTFGSSGTVAADFNVASGAGTHSVSATAASRSTVQTGITYQDVDVAVTVGVLASTNVAGGPIEPANIILRYQDTSHYFLARVAIQTDQSVTVQLMDVVASTIVAGPVTVPGLTHTGTHLLRVRAQVEGRTLRVKVWDTTAGGEPYDWHLTGNYNDANAATLDAPGGIGVRSGVASGNTNALPIVFSYTDWQVKIPRFAGEAMLAQKQDVSGQDQWVAVDAAGPLRRLSQGAAPLQSALRRSIPTQANLVAYWPCEEGSNATQFESVTNPGQGKQMSIGPNVSASAFSGFPASAPIPTISTGGQMGALLAPYTNTGQTQLRFLINVPSSAASVSVIVGMVCVGGTVSNINFTYYPLGSPTGSLGVQFYGPPGTLIYDSGSVAFSMNGTSSRLSLELTQSGGNVNFSVGKLVPGASAGYFTGSFAGTMGTISSLTFAPNTDMSGFSIGQVTVENAVTTLFALSAQLQAYTGESASDRATRLCSENSVPFTRIYGDSPNTPGSAAMGAQKVDTLLNLLTECVTADAAVLYESRGTTGLVFKNLAAHYNQPVTLVLDNAGNHLGQIPTPTDDDQQTKNDITVTRPGGGTSRQQLTSGRLSTLAAGKGGIGDYTNTVTANVQYDSQLPDLANWLLHLGTIDEARYPTIAVNLANARIAANTVLWIAALSVDVDTIITLANWSPDTILLLARGSSETLSNFQLDLSFNCAPGSPYNVVQLDTAGDKWDSLTTTLHAGITSSATSFQVDIGDGTLWTTDPAQMPIVMKCGGETMSVGAISGTTSPQTFSTVTRSVNGVVKAHNALDPISLATPEYLGK